jgi:hypothetical protein
LLRRLLLASIGVSLFFTDYIPAQISHNQGDLHGKFTGDLVLKPLPDGRNMKVVNDFTYTDWTGHTLTARAGFVSDGATIPRAVWSLVGGPWDGAYRDAAVVHDVGCVSHKYTWRDTHRLFYEAMLDAGVDRSLALTMYWGVLVGGPRWEVVSTSTAETSEALQGEISKDLGKLSETTRDQATIESSKVESKSHDTTFVQYTANISIPVPTHDVPAEQLKALRAELSVRAAKGETVSADEIEKRAEGVATQIPQTQK